MAESSGDPKEPREPGATLTRGEQSSLAVARAINERPRLKRLQFLWNENFGRRAVRFLIARRVYVENIEWLIDRPSDRGVMLAVNHRSFFDLHVATFGIYQAGARWPTHLYFPVRSNFFYENPLGVALNVLCGGGTLYPPIFREPAKASYTKDSVERLIGFLADPHTLVGIHPEGTRKKDDDPYTMLPAQPGVGQIALQARPLVVPCFINGLGNSAFDAIGTSFKPGARRDEPIIVVYGEALDYSDLTAQKPRAALYKKMADRMAAAITKLGAREKELREKCARGEIAANAPGWIMESYRRW